MILLIYILSLLTVTVSASISNGTPGSSTATLSLFPKRRSLAEGKATGYGFRSLSGVDFTHSHSYSLSNADSAASQNNNKKPHVPVVVARFDDDLFTTGWGTLNLETTKTYPDAVQAYAAGFAEGYLTAHHIYTSSLNMAEVLFSPYTKGGQARQGTGSDKDKDKFNMTQMPNVLVDFFQQQEDWTHEMVQQKATEKEDPEYDYFFQVGLVMEQFEGLVEGYEHKRKHLEDNNQNFGDKMVGKLDRWVFHMLNGMGDLNDLIVALLTKNRTQTNGFEHMDKEEALYRFSMSGMCSALVKVLPGNEDLLVGHSTWFSYAWTNRIFKHYYFNFNHAATSARGISFSSYPGFLESLDDFYMLSSNITWTQTSNTVLDTSKYHENNNLRPQSLLAWQRVRVASSMATSGAHFYALMKPHFSGTYANQYIIVDLNKFTPSEPLKNETLFVIEEMPGLIVGEDVTDVLRFGYWPSYNVPYFPEIYRRSGYTDMYNKFGKSFSYSLAPRAKIFRRDQNKVTDIETLKKFLRYNDFENDEYSFDGVEKNPMFSICSRGDLIRKHYTLHNKEIKPVARGCYDTKVTSFNYGAKDRKADIVSGPTSQSSGSKLEAFAWDQDFKSAPHLGLPSKYNFPFVKTKPFYVDQQTLKLKKSIRGPIDEARQVLQ